MPSTGGQAIWLCSTHSSILKMYQKNIRYIVILLIGAGSICLSACVGSTGSSTPDRLVGEPLHVAVERFGPSSDDDTLTVRHGDRLAEFYNGLYPTVIDTMRVGSVAHVRQLMWTGDSSAAGALGRAWRSVWPNTPSRAVWAVERNGEWVTVDALEWDDDVEF